MGSGETLQHCHCQHNIVAYFCFIVFIIVVSWQSVNHENQEEIMLMLESLGC